MAADWSKAIIVPVYKGKGIMRGECGRYRDINLLSKSGKLYENIITEKGKDLQKRKSMKSKVASGRYVWIRYFPSGW